MDKAVVIGNRRFTCLAPGLVRMEFSPTGQFEDRRSLVAYAEKKLRAFKSVRREKGATLLDTGIITIVTREDDKAFFPLNLETRWKHGGLLQLWRPGDKDYHNLGGTVRSLDVFNKYSLLTGVHTADMESPDAKAMEQIADNSFHVDPWFYRESGREDLAAKLIGKIHLRVRHRPDEVLVRTVNHATDQWRYGPGILSRSGYFFLNDSVSAVMDEEDFPVERNTPGTQDWYFFAYGDDYKLALRNWALLSGRSPLPAKHVFGIIMCRWPAFNEAEAKEYTQRFRKEGAPLSVMVIDMEWSKEGWCNWDWDHDHIGDPKKFFQWCRRNNMQVTLNVHPLHVREDDSHFEPYLAKAGTRHRIDKSDKNIPVDMCKKVEARAFMEVCHDEFLKHGVDFWWVDGCSGALNGTISQLVVNKVYFEHSDTAAKRGMLLSRYGGLGSHRYGVY
ncbi:MAG: glycoside hydrolase family 31 protein, partial [Planctomycetia bacterium]|nr:glycoside hydrolase family 31 protein [Planctomycetia bacterium]